MADEGGRTEARGGSEEASRRGREGAKDSKGGEEEEERGEEVPRRRCTRELGQAGGLEEKVRQRDRGGIEADRKGGAASTMIRRRRGRAVLRGRGRLGRTWRRARQHWRRAEAGGRGQGGRLLREEAR